MNSYIGKELEKRYETYRASLAHGDLAASKSVISLVLGGYLEQTLSQKPSTTLDPTFKAYATSQIRTFLFAGHDTTSSTICHIYYLLSKHPSTLEKLRGEHDSILGRELDAAGKLISDHPHLLNQLTYTFAVIKEAMRLFPPASSIREGVDGVSITDDDGNAYPTGKISVWIIHQAMQRSPKYWKQPNDFIPERWLTGPEDPLYPVNGAWRPFEYGPRNCIGQGLVTMELKVVLALTVREFDIRDAYEEFDRLNPRGGFMTVEGERAYQIDQGGAHPADRFPCRVSFRK
jgi:cytochrome P450